MSTTSVSVIVPTFNRIGFVETAITSVIEQDHEPLEVIAIDDGSTDDTARLLAAIARRTDPARFRWFRHENVGQAATINRGFEVSTGDLLGYLSSDDYLLPGAVSRLAEAIDARPEVDVVYPWFRVVDLQDREVDTMQPIEHSFARSLAWAAAQPGVGALVRREYYERIGGWDTRYKFVPDFEWWLRSRDARFLCVPTVLGAFRTHDGSMTARGYELEKLRERIRLLDQIYEAEDLPEDAIAVKHQAYAAALIVSALVLDGPAMLRDDRRFLVEDRLGPIWSRRAREGSARGWLLLAGALRSAEGQLSAALQKVEQLEQALTVLEDAGRWREECIATMKAEIETLRALVNAPSQSA